MGCGFVLHTILSKKVVDNLVALGNLSVFQDIGLVSLYLLIVLLLSQVKGLYQLQWDFLYFFGGCFHNHLK
jgi:hypothetical protein